MAACSVSVEGLRVSYGPRVAVDGVSFRAERGVTAIMGPNGSGKTSILKALAGIVGFGGSIEVCGLSPRQARRMISYVPAIPSVDPWARVIEVVMAYRYGLGGWILWGASDRAEALRSLEYVGALHLAERRFGELSGGEKRLVLLAGALARNPEVLLLDEPFSFLDLRNQVRIAGLVKGLSSATIIMAVHEPHHAGIADWVVLLNRGRVWSSGAPAEVLRAGVLREVYGVDMEEVGLGGRRLVIPGFWLGG